MPDNRTTTRRARAQCAPSYPAAPRRGSRRAVAVALAIAFGAQTSATLAAEPVAEAATPFDRMIGDWMCDGHFIKSGAAIRSRVSISRDDASGGLIVRHDDVAPGRYHAVELWTTAAGPTGTRAAIADRSGMRWYGSTGFADDVLTWTRGDGAMPVETFAYRLLPDGTMRIDWSIARGGQPLALGDTLLCRKG